MTEDRFDVRNYIRVYNTLDSALCDSIVTKLKTANITKHEWYNTNTNTKQNSKEANEFDVSRDPIHTEEIVNAVQKAVHNYMIDIKKLTNLVLDLPYGFTFPRFNIMSASKSMEEHYDHIHTIFDGEHKGIPTLSVIGLLNDDFVGGEFVLCGDYNVSLQKGDILIWPSLFMYPHSVKTVIKGTRHTFVTWGS